MSSEPDRNGETSLIFDPKAMRGLDLDGIVGGYFENRDYSGSTFLDYGGDWVAARELFDEEIAELTPLLQSGMEPSALNNALWEVEYSFDFPALDGLELGVAGVCAALCAAGCPTTFSCRGHHGQDPDYPNLHFRTESDRAVLVAKAARAANCRIENSTMDGAWVSGADLQSFRAFGEGIFGSRNQFERLGQNLALTELVQARKDPEVWASLFDDPDQ